MELPPWAYLGALLFASALLLKYLSGRHLRRRPNLPPGPKPWPIIGNLNLIGPVPWRCLDMLSEKYGPLMYLRFGSCPVVVGSSIDMAKFFLKTHDHLFANRPTRIAGEYTAYNYKNMVWAPYGTYWRLLRKLCLTELFSARRLESFEYIRTEEIRAFARNLFKSSGQCIKLKDYLFITSLNIISRMVLSKNYMEESEDGSVVSPAEFKWIIDEWFTLNGAFNIGDVIPWMKFLDLQGNIKRMKKMSKMFERFLEHVISEHEERRRREGEEFVARDMVDVLLQLADDPTLDVELNRDGLKGFTQPLLPLAIVAGGEANCSSSCQLFPERNQNVGTFIWDETLVWRPRIAN